MPTTTIRIPDDLKEQVAAAAERAGQTSHGFILDAIAEKVEEEQRRADFDDVAERRFAATIASGKTIAWDEMRAYLTSRLAGQPARRPSPKTRVR